MVVEKKILGFDMRYDMIWLVQLHKYLGAIDLVTKSMALKYISSHKVYICSMDVCGNVGRVDDESKNKFLKKLQEIFWRFR